jgi:hypothetical protein
VSQRDPLLETDSGHGWESPADQYPGGDHHSAGHCRDEDVSLAAIDFESSITRRISDHHNRLISDLSATEPSVHTATNHLASVGLRSGSQLVGDAVIPIPTIDL